MPDVFALELSSFQLESTSTLDADAATVLNVTEDHLDRYDGMADYAAAKARIFEGAGVQVLNRLDTWSMGMARARARGSSPSGSTSLNPSATGGLPGTRCWSAAGGAHARGGPAGRRPTNAANALAALALGEAIGLQAEPMLDGLRRFRGLPHRLQKVAEIGGIAFYDDSKGTNVGATVAALNGMTAPVVLIAGGDGKGQDFSPLAAAVSARAVRSFSSAATHRSSAKVLESTAVPLLCAGTRWRKRSKPPTAPGRSGDAVLLSPACASYDMFRSYVHRGEVFVQAVRALAAREGGARERSDVLPRDAQARCRPGVRPHARVARRAAAGAGARDGLFLVDRDRRRRPQHGLSADVLPRASHVFRRDRPRARGRRVPGAAAPVAAGGALSLRRRARAAGARAHARHRARSERQPPLDLAVCREPPAFRAHESVRRALRRRLHRAQGGVHAQPASRLHADVFRDAAHRRPAAARARFRRVRRDHGDRDGHPLSSAA